MLCGELYIADDPDLEVDHARSQAILARYNRSPHAEHGERDRLRRSLLGGVGDGVIVKPPFRCDYGTACQIATRVQLLMVPPSHTLSPIVIGSADSQPRRRGARVLREIGERDRLQVPEGNCSSTHAGPSSWRR